MNFSQYGYFDPWIQHNYKHTPMHRKKKLNGLCWLYVHFLLCKWNVVFFGYFLEGGFGSLTLIQFGIWNRFRNLANFHSENLCPLELFKIIIDFYSCSWPWPVFPACQTWLESMSMQDSVGEPTKIWRTLRRKQPSTTIATDCLASQSPAYVLYLFTSD